MTGKKEDEEKTQEIPPCKLCGLDEIIWFKDRGEILCVNCDQIIGSKTPEGKFYWFPLSQLQKVQEETRELMKRREKEDRQYTREYEGLIPLLTRVTGRLHAYPNLKGLIELCIEHKFSPLLLSLSGFLKREELTVERLQKAGKSQADIERAAKELSEKLLQRVPDERFRQVVEILGPSYFRSDSNRLSFNFSEVSMIPYGNPKDITATFKLVDEVIKFEAGPSLVMRLRENLMIGDEVARKRAEKEIQRLTGSRPGFSMGIRIGRLGTPDSTSVELARLIYDQLERLGYLKYRRYHFFSSLFHSSGDRNYVVQELAIPSKMTTRRPFLEELSLLENDFYIMRLLGGWFRPLQRKRPEETYKFEF